MPSSCARQFEEEFSRCTLTVELDPDAAFPGELVEATGGPWTVPFDTRVELAGLRAEVIDIERTSECGRCATCRSEARCDDCLACSDCTDVCAECVETLVFEVPPDAPAGPTSVVVFNRQGGSRPTDFTVLGDDGSDTDTDDTDTDDDDTDTDLPG